MPIYTVLIEPVQGDRIYCDGDRIELSEKSALELIKLGVISSADEQDPDNLNALNPDQAIALIEKETSVDTLSRWLTIEKRTAVKAAIKARISGTQAFITTT